MNLKGVHTTFKVPEGVDINIPDEIHNLVLNDFNNDKVMINNKPSNMSELELQARCMDFLALFYHQNEMELNSKRQLLVRLLYEYLPDVSFLHCDGFRYIEIDVHQRAINFQKL
jgi:hypothetical protein